MSRTEPGAGRTPKTGHHPCPMYGFNAGPSSLAGRVDSCRGPRGRGAAAMTTGSTSETITVKGAPVFQVSQAVTPKAVIGEVGHGVARVHGMFAAVGVLAS